MTGNIRGRLGKAEDRAQMLGKTDVLTLELHEDETREQALAREGADPGLYNLVVFYRLFRNLDGSFPRSCLRM